MTSSNNDNKSYISPDNPLEEGSVVFGCRLRMNPEVLHKSSSVNECYSRETPKKIRKK